MFPDLKFPLKEYDLMSIKIRLASLVTALTLVSLGFGGCATKSSSDHSAAAVAKGGALYDRLGGEGAIKAVVDDFVTRAAADPKVNFFRKGTSREWKPTDSDIATFKRRLVQFISMATGGPKDYDGKDMKTAHMGMKITSSEFDALAADLKASLDKLGVPAKEQAELLEVVGSTKKDIVEA